MDPEPTGKFADGSPPFSASIFRVAFNLSENRSSWALVYRAGIVEYKLSHCPTLPVQVIGNLGPFTYRSRGWFLAKSVVLARKSIT